MKRIISSKLAQQPRDYVDRLRDSWLAQGVEESARQRYHQTDGEYYVWGQTYTNRNELVFEDPVKSIEKAKKDVQSDLEDWVYLYQRMWVEECWPNKEGYVQREGCNYVSDGTIFELYDDGTGVFYAPDGREVDIPQQWIVDGQTRSLQKQTNRKGQ